MVSSHSLEHRVAAVEERLNDVEGGFGETICKLHRRTVRNELGITRLLDHFDLARPTEDEVDAKLDDE